MAAENDRILRLCVVQLDVIPQARRRTLWEPAEPRLDALPRDSQGRSLSVAAFFAQESGTSGVYQRVLDIAAGAMTTRLEEVLAYTAAHHADVVVFPEYAVPVACVPVLRSHSDGCAIVAGLGRIRNETEAAVLRDTGADLSDADELVGRNVSVLVNDGRITVVTKRRLAQDEDIESGTGPIMRVLRLGTREVRLGVAVCMDYLRGEETLREQGVELLCIPAYTGNVAEFRPRAPRDHVRLFANCAQHGGSTIWTTGLGNDALGDDLGVWPVASSYEAITMIEFDRFRQSPRPLNTPLNRLVLRSEIIERDSPPHDLLGRLTALLDRPERLNGGALAELASDSSSLGKPAGPFAEALRDLASALQQRVDDQDLIGIARNQLVVTPGRRPAAVREEQAYLAWTVLHNMQRLDASQPLGAALDLYRPAGPVPLIVFDKDDYVERVLRQQHDGTPLPPPAVRYALDERHRYIPDSALLGWVEQVVSLWDRQAGLHIKHVPEACRRFLVADAELRDSPSYSDPAWWREQIAAEGDPVAAATVPPPAVAAPAADVPPAADVRLAGGERRRDADRPDQQAPSDPREPSEPTRAESPEPSVAMGTISAEPQDDRVVIRWQVPPGIPAGVMVTVERLASQGAKRRQWAPLGNSVEDRRPPAGRLLEYLVRLQPADSHSESAEMRVSAVFAPPVTEPAAEQTPDGTVRGRWRPAPGLWETRVWRRPAHLPATTSDRVPVSSDRDGFLDPRPPAGRHVYSITPVYRAPDGEMTHEGRPETVDVTVADEPPVPRVTVDGTQDAHGVTLRWEALPPDAALLLCRAAAEPPGTAGDVLTLDQAGATGQRVSGRVGFTGTTASVSLPGGQWILIPFAVAGNLAVRGPAVVVDAVPAVTQAEATRNGPDVLVSWVWPEGMRMAEVVWRADGHETAREVTLHDFQRLGGVRFTGSGAAEARISGIFRSGTDVLVSAPVVVHAPSQKPTLTYHVHRLWPWQVHRVRPYPLHGPHWWCAARRLVLMADMPCTGLTVEIYVRTATGRTVSEIPVHTVENIAIEPGRPYEVMLEFPDLSSLVRPRFLSCRARISTTPIRVDDFSSTGREIRPCFR